jgi:hypothetical protein
MSFGAAEVPGGERRSGCYVVCFSVEDKYGCTYEPHKFTVKLERALLSRSNRTLGPDLGVESNHILPCHSLVNFVPHIQRFGIPLTE